MCIVYFCDDLSCAFLHIWSSATPSALGRVAVLGILRHLSYSCEAALLEWPGGAGTHFGAPLAMGAHLCSRGGREPKRFEFVHLRAGAVSDADHLAHQIGGWQVDHGFRRFIKLTSYHRKLAAQ